MGLRVTAITADSYIQYSPVDHEYRVWVGGQIVAYGKTYFDAEQLRTAYLAERLGRARGARG